MRLLGEDLIAFRVSSGEIGLIANNCPHRGASLFFGRNEEEGLRCVYHGWKFNVAGQCVDMPNEPAESDFKTRVQAVAYTTKERNGIIWAYLGPRAVPPPLPDFEANMLGTDECVISIIHRPCNWMQGWEGEMDTVHQAFLHAGAMQRRGHHARHLRLLHRHDPRAQVHRHRYALRHLVRRAPPGDRGHVLLAHRAHAVPLLRDDPGRADGPAAYASRRTCRWTTSTRCTGRSAKA